MKGVRGRVVRWEGGVARPIANSPPPLSPVLLWCLQVLKDRSPVVYALLCSGNDSSIPLLTSFLNLVCLCNRSTSLVSTHLHPCRVFTVG
jgi:hypothetical protein